MTTMKPIKRHAIDRALADDMLASQRRLLASGATIMIEQSEPRPLPQLITGSIWIAGLLSEVDPNGDELCVSLRMAASQTAGLFHLMTAIPGEHPIALGDGRRAILHNIGVTSQTSVDTWTTGFYIASIVRDRTALDRLASTPVAELRRSPTRADACLFLWVEVLQLLHKNESGVVAKLQEALDATDPARLSISDPDFILDTLVPEMQLLFQYIARDAAGFNEALVFALERHKKRWSGAKSKKNPEGFLALGPLAFAAMAHDAGTKIEVESDYLPRPIFEGRCIGSGA